jgi:hypothetical protein
MSITKQKIFPIQKNIKMNFTLTNNLDNELRICDITVKKPLQEFKDTTTLNRETSNSIEANDSIRIESPLEKILKSSNDILNNSFIIKTNTEYNIPFTIYCQKEFSGNLGLVVVSYRDKGLESFDETFELCSTIELVFPNLSSKIFDVSLSCNTNTSNKNLNEMRRISPHSEIPFNITLKNNSSEFKRLVFMVDTSNNYLTSGQVKKKLLLYPLEEKELNLSLIPVTFNKLKPPPFKIMEFPLANTSYENKIYSIYYLPDYSMN